MVQFADGMWLSVLCSDSPAQVGSGSGVIRGFQLQHRGQRLR